MLSTDTLDVILRALESRDCRPKPCRSGWRAKCPSHQDHQPSLSVSVGDSGAILLRCFAGCGVEEICAALGISVSDLFPPNADRPKRPLVERHERTNGRVYPTAEAALKILCDKLGTPTGKWEYFNRSGALVGVVCRWDMSTGKTVRPIAKTASGWVIGAMPEPRPLYGLKRILEADPSVPILVVEGEKCCDAVTACGLIGTTSAGGSCVADKSDWSVLAGRKAIVLPDADEAGERYAADVVRLTRAAGAAEVKVLRLKDYCPGLPPSGDIADVVASENWCGAPLSEGADLHDLGKWLLSVAERIAPEPVQRPDPIPADDALEYEPFPIDCVPKPLRDYIRSAAGCIGCDPGMVGLPVLIVCGAAIGGSRTLAVKRGWEVPCVLWGAIVGDSGVSKSPALEKAVVPLQRAQEQWWREYEAAREHYELERARWEQDMASWRRNGKGTLPPEEPTPPTPRRILVNDATLEALIPILKDNVRGLLLVRDELAGWTGAFDRYANRGRTSADLAAWLAIHGARPVTVDRKTTATKTIYVRRPIVNVLGGIQPLTLQRIMVDDFRESGLHARLLVTYPPRTRKQWSEADVPQEIEDGYVRVVHRLLHLPFDADNTDDPVPRQMTLSESARTLFIDFYNRHNEELADLSGDLAAWWAKLEEMAARLVIVVHCVRWACGETSSADEIDGPSMQAAITLTEWFKHEARRVAALLSETPETRNQRKLLDWLRRRGGQATPRDVQRGCAWLRQPGAAEAALQALVDAGHGAWQDVPATESGGRPTRTFALTGAGAGE